MKILIASGIFIPEVGGPATYADKLAREMTSLGHKVAVVSYSDKESYELDKDLPYKVYRVKRQNKIINYIAYWMTIKQVLSNNQYEVIYCFDYFSAGLPSVIANKKFNLKIMIRVGGDFIWERYIARSGDLVTLREFYQRGLHLRFEKLRFRIINWVFKQVDKIIFTTQFQRDIFVKMYYISKERTRIIPNPLANHEVELLDKIQPQKEILFVGRFIHKNNIFFLLDAFLEADLKGFSLHFIGEGPLKGELIDHISQNNIQNVSVEQKRIGSELIKRLKQGHLVVFPSLTDISPNSLLECLKNKIPFVATKEIGYDWLSGKAWQFLPQNKAELVDILRRLVDQKEYQNYRRQLAELDYGQTYSHAGRQTLEIINQI